MDVLLDEDDVPLGRRLEAKLQQPCCRGGDTVSSPWDPWIGQQSGAVPSSASRVPVEQVSVKHHISMLSRRCGISWKLWAAVA